MTIVAKVPTRKPKKPESGAGTHSDSSELLDQRNKSYGNLLPFVITVGMTGLRTLDAGLCLSVIAASV